jgi:hypothetical protein
MTDPFSLPLDPHIFNQNRNGNLLHLSTLKGMS